MNEVETLREGVMRIAVALNPEIGQDNQNIEAITLDLRRIKQPDVTNKLKKEILYLAGLLK